MMSSDRLGQRLGGRSWVGSLILALLVISVAASGSDWPMWRFDANRSAASPDELPEDLHLQWVREYPPREQVWDDPLNHDLMPYDRVFEPVVSDGRMFLGFNDSGKVVALSTKDGGEIWRFHTDGPVRLPPAVSGDRVFFASDDGFLYCVDCRDGELRWKFRGGPSAQQVLGNKHLISAWPARGGPVVRDASVYFAASIWPFMGTFVYALDVETGAVRWVNDGTSAQFIKQPHSADSFAGVGPQGALVATEDLLLVPGGRSVPAAFDRHSGEFKYFHINAGGKGVGGSFVAANDDRFFVHTRGRGVRAFELGTGTKSNAVLDEPVLAGDRIYAAAERPEDAVKFVQAFDRKLKAIGEFDADASGDLILAGNRLYAAGGGRITALSVNETSGEPSWSRPVEGNVVRLLAADNRLFAVTLEGRILCFGAMKQVPLVLNEPESRVGKGAVNPPAVLRHTDGLAGRALFFGADSFGELEGFLKHSRFRVDAVHSSPAVVQQLRSQLDVGRGVYGSRITVREGDCGTFKAPPYFARLIHVSGSASKRLEDENVVSRVYKSVRPYGGVLWIECASSDAKAIEAAAGRAKLSNAEITAHEGAVMIRKQGALPGSADWTHLYCDVANTLKSDDTLVKAPLGLLWFGGNSNMDVLPRHGHGPSEQVIGGRLFIEGMDSINARDVYTGEILWQRRFPDLGTYGVYYNETYQDTPLSPAYNQKHIPGANGRGPNFIATEDSVYLAISNACIALDARNGEITRTIQLPSGGGATDLRHWAYIGVYENLLLGGNGFAHFTRQYSDGETKNGGATDPVRKPNSKVRTYAPIEDLSASKSLVVFDRGTGEALWSLDARHSFPHNGIVAGNGRVYCLDRLPKSAEDKRRRRGLPLPEGYRIVALEAGTGKKIWEIEEGITGSWLSYSAEHDILLQAGARAGDRIQDEVGQGMTAYAGATGRVRWSKPTLSYTGPCILHNDLVMTGANSYKTSAGAFSLIDGSPHLIENPLTGTLEPWKLSRTYGCNTIVASEHLLTFRSGAAGYYDLSGHSGTGNIGGFKSGCTSNLIIANGVMNAPDYTRTCSCSYQNQTSLALIHMPEMEMWTYSQIGSDMEPGARLKRLGVNFGAPGDRRSDDGVLWLDYPGVGGQSPAMRITVEGEGLDYPRHHSAMLAGEGWPWVNASCVSGATRISLVPLTARTSRQPAAAPSERLAFATRDAADTAEENAAGRVTTSSSDLELVEDRGVQLVGLRFPDVQLPRGAEIESAFIQFTVDEASAGDTDLRIAIQDTANAPAFQVRNKDVSRRATDAESVAWKPLPWAKVDASAAEQATPDLKSLLRRVLARKDWKPGNAIGFTITGTGKRVARSRGEGSPRLVVTLKGAKSFEAESEPIAPVPYRVRLHFAEPNDLAPGERVFSVRLQGKQVLSDLDVRKLTGAHNRGLVKEFSKVPIADELVIEMSRASASAAPILSGIELIAEENAEN